ncbi:MAG: hypothetical protein RQ899_00155 [Pseudomonadales bacterium]|nr:hypothetical protein [Pseudomonadales bacterium]
MKKIYTNDFFSNLQNTQTLLESAGIAYTLNIDASRGEYPYFTFSELCLLKDEDYDRALRLLREGAVHQG